MKWIMMCGAPVVVAGGMYLHGPLKTSETYPRPASEAAWTLEMLQVPQAVGGMIRTVPDGAISRDYVPGKSISYFFHARGKQVGKFVAEMAEVDATHTRITSSFSMSGDADKLMQSEFMPMGKQFATVGAAAMQEQLDAQMERRPFDKAVVSKAMAGYAMANMGEIQQSAASAMNKAAAKFKEYDDQAAVRASGVSFQPGQPMIDPSKPSH